MSTKPYQRILLKLSGDALKGDQPYGIDNTFVDWIAQQVVPVHQQGIEIGIVIGGGNILRGAQASAEGMDRARADYMGMLATMINSMALADSFCRHGLPTKVMTALPLKQIGEPFIRERALRHLKKKQILIFAGGTGNPYFTTDTAAVLRGSEINADIIFKATKVDGVYSSDPVTDPNAQLYETLTYQQVLESNLKVMDAAAIAMCRDSRIPLTVFNLAKDGNILKAAMGERIGTYVSYE